MIRRDFFRFAAGAALGTASSGFTVQALSRFNAALESEEVRVPGGPERWARSVCRLCPAGCGLRVRVIGDRAVKVEGSPLSPINRGGLCPKGAAALQELYHPDRLRKPVKNIGSREKPRWAETSWDDALDLIAKRLARLRTDGQADGLVCIDGSSRSWLGGLFRRFLAAYGSPNYFTPPSGLDAVQAALYYQQGVTEPVAYDLENAKYVLSFGVDLLEGWSAPTAVMRAYGRWREGAAGTQTKFVQIEPRLSPTASCADEWVAVRPGTEAALALGIAYVLITEELYDSAFVRDHTFGFEDWRDESGKQHTGFRSLVLGDYRLNDVASLTGVPAERILELAREFGANRPALAVGDVQTSTLCGNPYAAMAVHSLNALAGNIDQPGGVLLQAAQAGEEPQAPAQGEWRGLLERMRKGGWQGMLVHHADPAFTAPDGETFFRALVNVPFVVSFSSFPDLTSSVADLVLPATTSLEAWSDAATPPAFPYPVVSIAPAAIAPRHQARHPGDVLLNVAAKLGGDVRSRLPFAKYEDYLRHRTRGIFEQHRGSVFNTGFEESWNRLLDRSGWWAPTWSTADQLWEQMTQAGGWWDSGYEHGDYARVLKTPSGRFEFLAQRLVGSAGGDDRLCLPHQPVLQQASATYPLVLLPFEVLPLAGGTGSRLPYLQQIAGAHLSASWESWVEIHPHTARKLGIADGDAVWVESPRGRARLRARWYEGAAPGAVHLPLGYGQLDGSGPRRGVNPLTLIEPAYEPLAMLPQTFGTFVKLYRA